jgi:2-C-methyl-D-erythritol 4-phosphate cytidylyltransferase
VLLAAGRGTRVGAETNKVFLPLAGRRVLTWSLDSTRALPGLVRTVLVLREQDRVHAETVLGREARGREVTVVPGGATRHDSELNALRALAPAIRTGEVDVVVIHDAARPLASPRLFSTVVDAARLLGGALPVLDQQGLVFLDGAPTGTPLVTVQTPQAFHALPLLQAYEAAAAEGFVGSDTAACIERYSALHVHGVSGDVGNIKITFPEDLFLAERLLARAHWRLT